MSCEIVGCRNTPRQWQRDGREGYYKRCWAHRDAVDESAGYKPCAVAGCMARVKYETCWAHRERQGDGSFQELRHLRDHVPRPRVA